MAFELGFVGEPQDATVGPDVPFSLYHQGDNVQLQFVERRRASIPIIVRSLPSFRAEAFGAPYEQALRSVGDQPAFPIDAKAPGGFARTYRELAPVQFGGRLPVWSPLVPVESPLFEGPLAKAIDSYFAGREGLPVEDVTEPVI